MEGCLNEHRYSKLKSKQLTTMLIKHYLLYCFGLINNNH